MISRIIGLGLVAATLAGCQTTGPSSVKGGECRIFERPDYAVRGKRQYDQDWIDGNVEAGVGGCGWKRPKARPASFDAVPGQKVAPVKKRGVLKRIKDRVTAPFAAPSAPVVEAPAAPVVIAPAPLPPALPPKPPRDAVDELLHPDK